MPTFGERLQQLREKAGLTQARLAEASGVYVWTIRNYEQGRREPKWKVAIVLARAIGVTVEACADCFEQPSPKRDRGRNAVKPKRGRLRGQGPHCPPKRPAIVAGEFIAPRRGLNDHADLLRCHPPLQHVPFQVGFQLSLANTGQVIENNAETGRRQSAKEAHD
jgi:DNA-binding XRE family transcriptional regulator